MSAMLKKLLGSVLSPGGSEPSLPAGSSRPPASGLEVDCGSLGSLDCLPIDVLMQILRLLEPRDLARSSLTCRAWSVLAADNRHWVAFLQSGQEAWDSIVFAETHLRPGLPTKLFYDYSPPQSFMQIYAQRASLQGSIIIDGGSGYCKYGWSKYSSPSGRCATFLEFGNIETPMYARLRHFFSTIFNRMQVKSSSQPVAIALPLCHADNTESDRASRRQYKETIYSVMFDLGVPAVCAIDQAVLALYAAKRTSGIVVNIGFHATSVVPILRGQVMRHIGVEVVGQGALKLTGFLKELMLRQNMSFESLYTVRTIKEKICYVALDYEEELRKNTRVSCEVTGEGIFTLSKERFQVAEILFQPQLGGMRTMSLHSAVTLCIDHCYNSVVLGDENWFKTIVLAGGTACLPGLSERLEKELKKMLPSAISDGIKVFPPPYGTDSAWHGAKMVSNVSTFIDTWCTTKKQFRQRARGSSSTPADGW